MIKKVFCVFICLLFISLPLRVEGLESEISAPSAIVVNGETGEVIFGKNINKKLPMASTTKIMTALILCENCDLDEEITVTDDMVRVEGSSMGLLPGDKVSFKGLLYGMMLPSGNDAANAFAISFGGSLENFSLIMNKRAAELGLNNTNFVTPSGLDAKKHYSTVFDMAKLSVVAMKNDEFRKAVSTDTIRLEYGNPPYSRSLSGHNKILEIYDGANGIKTGYTSLSGRCLVSSAERGNKKVIAVTLNDSNRWENHTKLLNYGFQNLTEYNLELPEKFSKIEIISGGARFVKVETKKAIVGLTTIETENLNYKLHIKRFIYAPAKKGQTVGRIDFYIKDNLLKSLDIKVSENTPIETKKQISFKEKFIINLKLLLEL